MSDLTFRNEEERRKKLKELRGEKSYVYEEYPRRLYRVGAQWPPDPVEDELVVNNDTELDGALETGEWQIAPPMPPQPRQPPVPGRRMTPAPEATKVSETAPVAPPEPPAKAAARKKK